MYEMKPEYYIGIDMIDEEHKQLFKYADEAYELLHDEFTPDKYDRIDVILENLRNYTVKHFSDEEQYMESINYKKIFTQKVQHQEFIHKFDEFMEHHNDEEKIRSIPNPNCFASCKVYRNKSTHSGERKSLKRSS